MIRALLLPALTVAISAPAAAAFPVASATITLTNYRYTPAPIYLAAGVPVRLVFVNQAGKSHDFTAPAFFRAARILGGRVAGGKVDLGAGQSEVIDLIPARGSYKVVCRKFGHRMLGMSTMIIVGSPGG